MTTNTHELIRLILELHVLKSADIDSAAGRLTCPKCKAAPGAACVSPEGPFVIRGKASFHAPRIDAWIGIHNGMCPSAWIDDLVVYKAHPREVLAEVLRSPGYKRAKKHGLIRGVP